MDKKKEEKLRKKQEKEMDKLLKKTVLKEEKKKVKEVHKEMKPHKKTVKEIDKVLKGKEVFGSRVAAKIDGKNVSGKTEMKKEDSVKKKKAKAKNGEKKSVSKIKLIGMGVVAALVLSTIYYFISQNILQAALVFFGLLALGGFSVVIRKKLKYYGDIKKMEDVFPDFISLMSSNLRAGMTIDRALLLSSRKEFAPLDKEILQVGKDILTAKEISVALKDMADRIKSEEITKTVQLIISGIKSGGNLSVLLEQTANNMRERIFVKKRASSNVLMYVIFIFFAVAVGAPLLFGLSSVLVEIMTNIFSGVDVESVNVNLPFTLSSISISTTFVFYFSIIFNIMSAIMASLILGLVSKGKERDGLKYTVFLIISAVTVFLVSRMFLLRYFANSFG
jgi:flagellar protein FlaJ